MTVMVRLRIEIAAKIAGEKAGNANVRGIRAFEIRMRPSGYIKRRIGTVIMIIAILSYQFREPQSRLDPLAAAIDSSHSPRIRCVLLQMPLLQVLPPMTGNPVQVSEE